MIKLNGTEVEFGRFPNGEVNLPIADISLRSYNEVEWMYEADEEFFLLALLKDFIDNTITKAYISIHYMPHSRMDRANESYWFSLKTAAKMVNNMGWDYVHVVEPHSDVTPALLDKSFTVNWCMANIQKVLGMTGSTSLFFPDAGAAKRYTYNMPYAVGNKRRNFKTGEIESFTLSGDVHEKVLIVDDMCSKGGTFVHSARLLKTKGAMKVNLLVAYCEPTVFKGELFDHIDKMYVSENTQLEERNTIVMI